MNWVFEESGPRVWEGNLVYFPPRASRWFPEHFQGVIRELTSHGVPKDLNLAFAIGDTYAAAGLGASGEYDVGAVDDWGGGVIVARFGQLYTCYLFNSVSWAS